MEIKDFGSRIFTGDAGNITKAFCRADNTKNIERSGLGCYFAVENLDQFNCSLLVESVENKSTSMNFKEILKKIPLIISLHSLNERIVTMLLQLNDTYGIKSKDNENSSKIEAQLSRNDLASLVGTTTETIVRGLIG